MYFIKNSLNSKKFDGNFFDIILMYCPHSKNIHNVRDLKLKFLEIQSMFHNLKFSKNNYDMQMGCNVHDIREKNVAHNTRN
jgi:hypothetical protein